MRFSLVTRGCEKRRIIGSAMPTRYVGLFCPDRHFNVVGTYEVEHMYAPVLVQRIWDTQAQCEQCRKMFSFQQSDVAHSNSPDGRDARYPHKLAAC